jgi:succinoglycan biosynthesis transport protein ExoP
MQEQGPYSFDRLAEVWSRRKWVALAVFSLAAAGGVTIALSLPDIYRSTATVIVEQGRTETVGLSGEIESRLQLISQEILSRSHLTGLVRQFGLYPALRQRAPMESVAEQMRWDIHTQSKVQPQPSGIGATIAFTIDYRSRDREVVAKVANALASSYLEEDAKIRERQASGATQVLKGQLEDVKGNLEEQERALGNFQEQHLGELPDQTEANVANLDRLHADLRTVSEERIRALDRRNELMKELAEADEAGTSTGGGPGPAAARLVKKQEELAELSRRYSDKYPDVIRLKGEVAALEREAAQPGPATASGAVETGGAPGRPAVRLREAVREVESDISRLRSDEGRLRSEIAEHIRRLENAPRRQRDYQEIARDHQTTRDLYDSLRKRYEQAQLAEGDGERLLSSPLRILDPAVAPTGPIAPNRVLLLILALVGSLAAAAIAAALAERLDTSLHTPDDVRAFTRIPLMASIPLIVTAGDLRARRRRFGFAAVSFLLGMAVVVHSIHAVSRTSELLVSVLARSRP